MNKFLCLFVSSTMIGSYSNVVDAANILVALPSNGRSHFKPFQPFFFELARRGHNLTVISVFPPTVKQQNYHQLNLDHVPTFINDRNGFGNLRKLNRYQNWIFFVDIIHEYCFNLSRQNVFQNLVRSNDTRFDLIFVELYHIDGFFALAHRFDCPIIGLSFQPILTIYHWLLKNPITSSYIPHSYSPYSDLMNLWQKFNNFLLDIFTILYYNFVSISSHQKIINSLLESQNATKIPNVVELTRRLTMIFEESHFSVDHVRPHLPNVIDVAGIHFEPDKPLPQDIDNFINEASNGVIYISFGSLIEPRNANDLALKFVNLLKKLPYRVVWKWDPAMIEDRTNDNFLIRQWLPQNDILRHPKCVLFVSHGGYHSLLEAINSGVPILGLPFFTDQYHNMAIAEKLGVGRRIDPDASIENLELVLQEVLSNERYKINAKKQSVIFKDRPQTPLNTAVYWTEYVLRHKGTDHMRSSAVELYWFQYLLLDVALFFAISCFIFVFIFKIIVRNYSKICYSNDNRNNSTTEKSSKKD